MDEGYILLKDAAERYDVALDRLRRAAYDGRLLVIREEKHWPGTTGQANAAPRGRCGGADDCHRDPERRHRQDYNRP
jgi:hypothetical protein